MNLQNSSSLVNYGRASTVSEAVGTRRSVRAFLPTPVPSSSLLSILNLAARAPSGTNMQPWKTYVLTGNSKDRVCSSVCRAFDDPAVNPSSQVDYYPSEWFEPYLSRRRQVGWQLYGLLGIKKGDREATHTQHRRNFVFFDAPVGLIFTIHKDLATGSWLDYGMYLQNIMLLAREQGMHTCPQAAWADYHDALRTCLALSEEEIVVCGMAIGFADSAAVENSLVTERVDDGDNVCFVE